MNQPVIVKAPNDQYVMVDLDVATDPSGFMGSMIGPLSQNDMVIHLLEHGVEPSSVCALIQNAS